jgi:hypothetical protein
MLAELTLVTDDRPRYQQAPKVKAIHKSKGPRQHERGRDIIP